MFHLVRNERLEVPADDAMPKTVVLVQECLLQLSRDLVLSHGLVDGLLGGLDGEVLHLLAHVDLLYAVSDLEVLLLFLFFLGHFINF